MPANIGIDILIFIIVLIVIGGIIAIIILLSTGQQNLSPVNQPCSVVDSSQLIDVSEMPCVVEGNTLTSDKLTVNHQPLCIITPNPYPYKTACATLCKQVSEGHCVDINGDIDMTLDPSYQSCLNTLAPNGCVDEATPLGISGNTIYYAKSFYTADVQTSVCK